MAVVNMPISTVMSMKIQTGVNISGFPVYKTVSFSSIKPDAVDADLYAVGSGLAGLQSSPVAGINRVNSGSLVNQ